MAPGIKKKDSIKLQFSKFTCWQTWARLSNVEEEDKCYCNVNQGVHPLDDKHYHKRAQCLNKEHRFFYKCNELLIQYIVAVFLKLTPINETQWLQNFS